MKKIILYLTIVLLTIIGTSCKDYVTNVDPLIDRTEDANLNNEDQVPFLVAGVQTYASNSLTENAVLSDGLSDLFYFDPRIRNATYPQYEEIDAGLIPTDNNSVRGAYTHLGRLRKLADTLVYRVLNNITFTDESVKAGALFIGYFYGGYARMVYASEYGSSQLTGGSPIDGGKFIPSATLYKNAIDKFMAALPYGSSSEKRVVNSLIAKCYLYLADYANAATYANQGMDQTDLPYDLLYSDLLNNYYYQQAGVGRHQWGVDQRMLDYINADSTEAARIPMYTEIYRGYQAWFQDKYPDRGSSYSLMTWQENYLMRAELSLRGQDSGDPLTLVNEVRDSHIYTSPTTHLNYHIPPLTSVVLYSDDHSVGNIYDERDKELCFTGNRLADERRFNEFHLGSSGTYWEYLPITIDELNTNTNL